MDNTSYCKGYEDGYDYGYRMGTTYLYLLIDKLCEFARTGQKKAEVMHLIENMTPVFPDSIKPKEYVPKEGESACK